MREIEYEVSMRAYRILSTNDVQEHNDSCNGTPIKMSELHTFVGENPFERILQHTYIEEVTEFEFVDEHEDDGEDEDWFDCHYPEVIRGEYPHWQLSRVSVGPDFLQLVYENFHTLRAGVIDIGPCNFDLIFEGTRSKLGFDPVYRVTCRSHENGKCSLMRIDEEFGYAHRTIEFAAIERGKPNIAVITEHLGM